MTKTLKCSRCGRRWRGHGDWNFTMKTGVVVGCLCPTCQTPEENAEAEINEATLCSPEGRDPMTNKYDTKARWDEDARLGRSPPPTG